MLAVLVATKSSSFRRRYRAEDIARPWPPCYLAFS
jgi:hypothetical protein